MNRNMARSYNRKVAGGGGSYVIDSAIGQSFGEPQVFWHRFGAGAMPYRLSTFATV
jgi:hypothetical protein